MARVFVVNDSGKGLVNVGVETNFHPRCFDAMKHLKEENARFEEIHESGVCTGRTRTECCLGVSAEGHDCKDIMSLC